MSAVHVQCHGGPLDGAPLEVEMDDGDEIVLGIRKVEDGYSDRGVWRWCADTQLRLAAYRLIRRKLVFLWTESVK